MLGVSGVLLFFLSGLALILILIYRHRTWKAQPWPKGSLRVPAIQAHRGYWQAGDLENSQGAFAKAKTYGYQMAELDVRLTQDSVVVVFHDRDILRFCSTGKPPVQDVEKLSFKALKGLVEVATLEEVLKSSERPPFLNIELKSVKVWDSTLEKVTVELVKKCQLQSNVIFSSFNPLTVFKLSCLLPQVPRALLSTRGKEVGNSFYLRKLWLAPYVRCNALHLDHRFVSEDQVAAYKIQEVPVALWTVNDKQKAQAILKAGALSVISDILRNEDVGPVNVSSD